VAAVREGRPPLVDGAEARKSLLVIEAVYRSAQLQQWVEMTDGTPSRTPETA
jgi:predicted dehydrogenase